MARAYILLYSNHMLNRKKQKSASCFLHYFLFYAVAIAYLPFTGCFGVRKELIPKRNELVRNISEKAKERYRKLFDIAENDGAQKKLEEAINHIKNQDDLEKFIHQRYERTQMYRDLLAILPKNEAIALKNNIDQAGSQDEVDELIALKFPTAFKQLDDSNKEKFFNLADDGRKKVLKNLMQQSDTTMLPAHQKTGATTPHAHQKADVITPPPHEKTDTTTPPAHQKTDATAPPPDQKPKDISQLIKEQQQIQQKKGDDTPQDSWGTKLPLKGDERKRFLNLINIFSQSDQNYLKELFNQTGLGSLKNFFKVFFTGFSEDERIGLLETMIILYKDNKDLALTLCNNPKSLSGWNKGRIGLLIGIGYRTSLLKKLDKLLS
ncbi:hypothetical protein [Cardinium endosymbiont of Nabis limbatus]|uniref:hypothetical protein n=1 Tax=Cardinium endosymbiont of Nabis limbatus TaxID=3066217 RepID=UPI003AF3E3A8